MDYVPAKYTVVLHTLLKDPEIRPLIDKALSSYPLYQKQSEENFIPSMVPTREQLNKKLLNYYKYREIGFETIARFVDELEISMNEIMPKYNQLFFAADLDYDVINNVDYTREIIVNKNSENTQNVNENGTSSNTTEQSGSHSNKVELSESNSGSTNQSGSSSSTTEQSGSSTSTSTTTSETNDSTNTQASINNYNKSVKSSTPQESLSISNVGIDTVTYADEIGFNHDTNSESGSSTGTTNSETNNQQSGTNTNESSTTGTTTNGVISSDTTTSETNTSGSDSNQSSATGATTNEITTNGTRQEDESTKEKTYGNMGSMSTQRQVQEYIDIIRNIEQEIINDPRIQELFMMIY